MIWYYVFMLCIYVLYYIIVYHQGNNIFMSMSAEDYKRMIDILENAILSTDLALYFK